MVKYFFIIAQKKWLFKPLFYDCIFKTTYMFCWWLIVFWINFNLRTDQPFFTGSQPKLHRLFFWLLQRWSSHDSVVRCHLLRKCSVCTRNGSPQASLFRPISVTSCPLPRLFGQALTRLVTVSSMCYHTSTPALSTSSSSRGFTPFGWDISSWGGLHA